MSKKRIILTAAFALLSLMWMSVIFGFSADDAKESSEQSHGVVEMILKIFVPGFEEMEEAEREALIAKYDKPVRKTAHFASYALLAFLLCLCFGSAKWFPENKLVPAMLSLPVCVLFAFSDEYHQTFVEGRAGRLSDVVIDGCGALCGILVATAAAGLLFGWLSRRDVTAKID